MNRIKRWWRSTIRLQKRRIKDGFVGRPAEDRRPTLSQEYLNSTCLNNMRNRTITVTRHGLDDIYRAIDCACEDLSPGTQTYVDLAIAREWLSWQLDKECDND